MPPELPSGRYDQPRRRNRVLAGLIAGVLVFAALAGAYGLYSRHQSGRLDAELTGYEVRSDSVVRITVQVVTRGKEGECKVRARNRAGEEAGAVIVPVHPSGRRSQLLTVDLPTRSRAVNGELVGCRPL